MGIIRGILARFGYMIVRTRDVGDVAAMVRGMDADMARYGTRAKAHRTIHAARVRVLARVVKGWGI
jgi:hypothetical protein